tara:strand:- start:563 stop:901 length:339 start_codon:yes stop_codon:yes gene_type:complete
MVDNGTPPGSSKKIIFEDTDKRHADLKIRLHYDGLSQGAFFRMLVSGYIEQDKRIVDFIGEYKEKNKVFGKQRLAKTKSLYDKSQKMKDVFGLDENEIEDIFDIIAKENNEL